MGKDSTVTNINQGTTINDPLTEILREGARKLLTQAIEAEVEDFINTHKESRDSQGRQAIVRNGYLPEREIQTGIGAVSVKKPRIRNRGTDTDIFYSSSILPSYLRKTKTLESLIPWLYLKGISTGALSDALSSLLGHNAPGLSASTVSRLKESWNEEYNHWSKRDLSKKRYAYIWADGIYLSARMESKQCLLVLIGALSDGRKELLAIEDGYRESEQSWQESLLDLKHRGLEIGPELAVGDGSLGFWKALHKVYGKTRQQRCWVHKTSNILNKLPKGEQAKAKSRIHDIWMAPTKKEAHKAFDLFIETYKAKYPKAADCLRKDREELLAFYDFPAEHWRHIRTTNPIESTFATVKLRTAKTRGCLSRETALTMVFQLCRCAQKGWQKLNGSNLIGEVITGIKFVDGNREDRIAA